MTDDKSASSAFLKDELDKQVEDQEPTPRPEAVGLEDEQAVEAMIQLLRHYPSDHPEMPDDPRDSRLFREIVEASGTKELRQAVRTGDYSEINFFKGISGDSQDLSGYDAIRSLERLLTEYPTFQMYIFGPTPPVGAGKTDFALLLSEIAERSYDDIDLATNITSTDDDVFNHIECHSDMVDWLQEDNAEKLFILDEGSQALTSHEDRKAGIQLSKFLKLIRKCGGNIIIIGHTGRDIARDVRRQLIVCKKHDKKHATIGYGLKEEDEQIEIADKELELEGIPETTRQYDTRETSEWTVDIDEEDGEEGEDKKVKCKGHTSDGSPCSAMTDHKSGYCMHHRDQWDPDSEGKDPRFGDE